MVQINFQIKSTLIEFKFKLGGGGQGWLGDVVLSWGNQGVEFVICNCCFTVLTLSALTGA